MSVWVSFACSNRTTFCFFTIADLVKFLSQPIDSKPGSKRPMVADLIFPTLWVDVLIQYITEGNHVGVSAK